ncbi:MAG: dihydrodipicolinate synthase family protein [Alistipes sp.]|nr:dihydrodipicolinate synthase family protein [Alistipes sp.]
MQPLKLRGIIPPMITPLKGNDELDREGAIRLTEHILAGGVHALFLLGTTGEAQSLTYELRYEFVELVCRQVAGRVPILVGVTDTSLDESVRMAAHAAKCGAAGVVAAAPYYFAPSQQELVEYYTALADALPLPLYLYNMPSHVKVFLEPATVKTLADHPNIVGLKDSSANMNYFQTLIYHLGERDDFSLYVGPEELTGESVLLGADGGVNGGANIFPELYVAMYDAAASHDVARVRELQRRIMRISTTIYTVGKYGSSYLKGVKCALSLLGICDDYLSYPYRRFRAEERARIREALEVLGADCKE